MKQLLRNVNCQMDPKINLQTIIFKACVVLAMSDKRISWKRTRFRPPRSGTMCVQADKHRHCFESNLGERLVRDRAERVWTFSRATMTS